jgi:L-2-hydroxyglutarate oxidase LhgO
MIQADYYTDVLVIGAGVIGLALAREFGERGYETVVLEKNTSFGQETSSRNSEVIHAGIYYEPNSLKAKLCVEGKAQLYNYCVERAIPHQRIGKIIVANTPGQCDQLHAIKARAAHNNVHDLEYLSDTETMRMAPGVKAQAGLLSPSTGIIDSHSLMLSFIGDIESTGGVIAYRTQAKKITPGTEFTLVTTQDANGESVCIGGRWVINAAGLHAVALAKGIDNFPQACVPRAVFAKGSYFSYATRCPFDRLIYPVPEAGGLGIHLTLDLAGNVRFGPDVEWINTIDYKVESTRAKAFLKAISNYLPSIDSDLLIPDYAGVRPKIADQSGIIPDFVICGPEQHNSGGIINLFGIESPGLTSCLALASYVCDTQLV